MNVRYGQAKNQAPFGLATASAWVFGLS